VELTRNRGAELTRQHWPQWVVAVAVLRRVVLGQLAYAGPANASSTVRPLVELARQTGTIGLVVADAEFASERHHHSVRDDLGADSIIPATRGKPTWQLHGMRTPMRASFPTARYRQRTLVESVFSAAQRKRSARAPGRLPVTQHLRDAAPGPRLRPLPRSSCAVAPPCVTKDVNRAKRPVDDRLLDGRARLQRRTDRRADEGQLRAAAALRREAPDTRSHGAAVPSLRTRPGKNRSRVRHKELPARCRLQADLQPLPARQRMRPAAARRSHALAG
jgi:hypothetical protein